MIFSNENNDLTNKNVIEKKKSKRCRQIKNSKDFFDMNSLKNWSPQLKSFPPIAKRNDIEIPVSLKKIDSTAVLQKDHHSSKEQLPSVLKPLIDNSMGVNITSTVFNPGTKSFASKIRTSLLFDDSIRQTPLAVTNKTQYFTLLPEKQLKKAPIIQKEQVIEEVTLLKNLANIKEKEFQPVLSTINNSFDDVESFDPPPSDLDFAV
eukprot:TRINITY_DN14715_c0_g1_i1.p1 TRINITY_DN14715_c0_g1~~TRINITY_DN14715_c0_g1_i1.p1  ORF type:complete len:206 (+),score=59.71 TRINITY_DN14715_c0_g1_i1:5-622(+)